jgi:vacuolar-type H+-ATPase subunit I/STV1
MIDYVKTIIYKIYCKTETIKECYVGHTTNFKQRKIEHKYACCNENSKSYNTKVYEFIRNNGGFDNWDFIEIEKFPCKSKAEAHMRENYWYFNLQADLNSIAPSLDLEKEKIRENRKRVINQLNANFNKIERKAEKQKYLEENSEQIKEQQKQVRQEYAKNNRDKLNANMREYNKKTKERRAELAKIYYEKRKANGYYN